MENLFFWNRWQKSHRLLYGVFMLLFVISCFIFLYSEFLAKNSGLAWNIIPQIKSTGFVLDSFQKGFFSFTVTAENQYILQHFEGSLYNSPDWCSYLVAGTIILLLITGSVTASYTKGIWYYASLTIIGIFFFLLNLDVLEVFGLKKMYWTVGWFLIFGITTHIFHAYKPLTPILTRYLIFSAVTALFWISTLNYSTQVHPLRSLVAYGWMAPLSIALLYIIIISTDILAGFLFLVTDSKHAKKSSSLLNFFLISLFYLGNITLTFMKNRGSLDWNIFYIEAPVLLLLTSILGIWSFKKKEPVYQMFADFTPATAVWFLVMAINCLLCYSFVNFTANDPLQEVLEDAVIFTQLTMGAMFMIYVVANLMGMMEQNLQAHMVLYKPRFMPFAFVRIVGLILIFSIVLYNSNYQYRQAVAGQHILKAENFIAEDNLLLAEEYLNNSLSLDGGNHKGNYQLAMLLRQKSKDNIIAKGLLKQSMTKNPSQQAYASLGYDFLQEGDVIRSLEILREGKIRFPKSKEILNNLALAFTKTDLKDSTFYYLQLARKADESDPVAPANQLAFAITNNIAPDLDNQDVNNLINKANLLALLNKSGKKYIIPVDTTFLNDSIIQPTKVAYVVNLALNNLKEPSHFPNRWFDSILKKPGNAYLQEDLLFAKACRQYYSGNIADGIITLDQVQATAQSSIKYNNVLSNWLIQQDAPRVAMDFLAKAKEAGDVNADFGMAIASSFYMPANEALQYWRSPVLQTDSTFKNIVNALHETKPNVFTVGILPQLYGNAESISKSFQGLEAGDTKNKSLGRFLQHLNHKGNTNLVMQLYQTNPKTDESTWQYLRALKKAGQNKKLAAELKDKSSAGEIIYLKAWINESPDPQKAEILYTEALRSNPLYEEGIMDAYRFLKTKLSDQETYDLLLTSVMLNQYSIEIQKAYTLQCIQANYFNFADYSLKKLEGLMAKNEYQAFAKEVEAKKEKRLSEIEWK